MTQEEKAKAYDEAIEKLRRLHDDYDTVSTLIDIKEELESIFPQLKESEDERIRKELIKLLNDLWEEKQCLMTDRKDYERYIDWIEKQGEKEIDGEDYGIDGLWHAQRILERTLGEVDGYQSDDGILEHKAAIGAIKELYERKPAWSDNDEEMLCKALYFLDAGYNHFKCTDGIPECKDWLKSIKDRVQPKQEWSEEDDQYLLVCKNALAKYQVSDKWDATIISRWLEDKLKSSISQSTWNPSYEDKLRAEQAITYLSKKLSFENKKDDYNFREGQIKWLKSLKARYTWKPSEEQLDALHDAAVYVDKSMFPYPKEILMKLYKQLKKLREE